MANGPDANNKHAYLEFCLEGGIVLSSRDIHFRDVELSKITKINMYFRNNAYSLDKAILPSNFLEFIHYRSAGSTMVLYGTVYEPTPIRTWTIGWTDGITEYLDEYNFKGGKHVRRHTNKRDFIISPTHYHPQSVGRP